MGGEPGSDRPVAAVREPRAQTPAGGDWIPRPPVCLLGGRPARRRDDHRTTVAYFRTVTFLASTKPLLMNFTWVKYTPRETT